jgi:hypothetical protein
MLVVTENVLLDEILVMCAQAIVEEVSLVQAVQVELAEVMEATALVLLPYSHIVLWDML